MPTEEPQKDEKKRKDKSQKGKSSSKDQSGASQSSGGRRRVFDPSAAKKNDSRGRSRGKRRGGGRRGRSRNANGKAPSEQEEDAFGTTWWGKRWIEAIENVSTAYANRLPRGLNYAKHGHVKNLKVKPGRVEAQVRGRRSNPYKVTINLRTLSDSQWTKVVEVLGDRAAFTASLLAGEMPERITDVFEQCGLSLFPQRMRELKASCSCPDWANPCKHIAATHYLIGDALDDDPFLLLTLRGRTREDVLAALRAARSGDEVADDGLKGPGKERYGISVGQLDAKTFFDPQDDLSDFRFHIAEPEVEMALLRQLGDPPHWDAGTPLLDYLADVYQESSDFALQLGMREVSDEAPELPASVLMSQQKEEELTEEERRALSVPPGAEIVSMPSEDEADNENEEERPSEGPTILVRRASKVAEQQREQKHRKRKERRRRSDRNKSNRNRKSNKSKKPRTPASDAPRLSRRVVPGTMDGGNAPTLEDRLEMIIPITEAMPDGPKIARQIIWALKTHGPATARQLARRTRMKKTAVLSLLKSLLAVGLVIQEGQGERARYLAPPS